VLPELDMNMVSMMMNSETTKNQQRLGPLGSKLKPKQEYSPPGRMYGNHYSEMRDVKPLYPLKDVLNNLKSRDLKPIIPIHSIHRKEAATIFNSFASVHHTEK
jgi:hypothetical protein